MKIKLFIILFLRLIALNIKAHGQYYFDLDGNSTKFNDLVIAYNHLCIKTKWQETKEKLLNNSNLYKIYKSGDECKENVQLQYPSEIANNKEVSIRIRNDFCQIGLLLKTSVIYCKFRKAILKTFNVGLEYDHLTDYMSETKMAMENIILNKSNLSLLPIKKVLTYVLYKYWRYGQV